MADDVTLPGAGSIIKTIEKIGGEHVQLVALDIGATTTSTPVVAGQTLMAASVPVAIASNQSALSTTGDAAHDAADAGAPIKIGGRAVSAIPSVVSANDRVNAYFDLYGRQVNHIQVMSHEPPNEFMGRWTTAAVAAEAYGWGFENPIGSGKTCIIDQMWLASVETSVITLVHTNAYTATQNATQCNDLRTLGNPSVTKLLSAFAPSGVSYVCTFPFYAGEKLFLPFNGAWRLYPGEAIAVYKEAGSTNGVIYWNIMWRELP